MRRAIVLALALAACGGEGDLQRCSGDAECGAGRVCNAPVAGERGVCIAPLAVAITAPTPDAWVGTAGVPVEATVRIQVAGYDAPASLQVRVGGASVATLAPGPSADPSGTWTYRGWWTPATGAPATAALEAAAPVGAGEVRSAPVTVRVDTEQPAVAIGDVTCATSPCLRDGRLTVRAVASDANVEGAYASLDLDGHGRTVEMARSGNEYSAELDLGAWPFHALARKVTVRVEARDVAGNKAGAEVQTTFDVTRVVWTQTIGAGVTTPAVMEDGTLVVGTTDSLPSVQWLDPGSGAQVHALAFPVGMPVEEVRTS